MTGIPKHFRHYLSLAKAKLSIECCYPSSIVVRASSTSIRTTVVERTIGVAIIITTIEDDDDDDNGDEKAYTGNEVAFRGYTCVWTLPS